MPSLEQIRATFAGDRFATEAAGCEIRLAEPGHAICAMKLQPHHLNAAGTPQGGALFTLADLAMAAAANAAGRLTLTLSSHINFLRSSGAGDTLMAEARERYVGRTTGCYQVDITNQHGELIATFESSVFRKGDPLPFATRTTDKT